MKAVLVSVALLVVSGASGKLRDYSDRTFTVLVPPNTPDQCYHIPDIKFRQDVDVFFQVVRAYWSDSSFVHQTPPEMSVNMQVIDPAGKVLKSAVNGQFENYRFNAAGEGAHKICLFSYYGNKNVYIRVTVSTPEDPDKDPFDVYDYFYEEDREFGDDLLVAMRKRDQDEVAAQFDTTVKAIKEKLQAIRTNLQLTSGIQGVLMSTLTKDMYVMFGNLYRVNFFSIVYITVMVLAGLLQVFVIRKLFDGHNSHQKIKAVT